MNRFVRPPWIEPPPGNEWCADCIQEGCLCRSCEDDQIEAAREDAHDARMEAMREDRDDA